MAEPDERLAPAPPGPPVAPPVADRPRSGWRAVLRARLASIEVVSYTSGPLLGNTEAGAAAALFGVRASVVSGGVLCAAAVLATSAVLPVFRGYDDRRGNLTC